MSLYAEYVTERTNRKVIEDENGFIIYEYIPGEIVFITDFFVTKEKRRQRIGFNLVDKVVEQAVKDGKTHILGSADLNAKNVLESIATIKAYGMTLCREASPTLFFSKPIGIKET